jgi:hypothetical protein
MERGDPTPSPSRIAVIVTAWLGVVAVAAVAYWLVAGDAALLRGRQRYAYRESLKAQVEQIAATRPSVLWMGDSTILGLTTISYPQMVQGGLPGVSSTVIGFPGCDYFTYYPLVGDLLSRYRPAVLVIVAHLRFFRPPSTDPKALATTRNDLASMIPNGELGRAVWLPFETRGLTLPRLALARLLRWDAVETAVYVTDGARAQYGEADIPWLGPPKSTNSMTALRLLGVGLGGSNVAVTRHHPTVRMMEATVRLAHEAGVRVIVIGSPIPFEAMRESAIGYDPAVYAERFAVLGDAVRDAGGVFVDLHEALPQGMFRDEVGHFTADGAKVLAERLRPVVVSELEYAMSASRTLRDDSQN